MKNNILKRTLLIAAIIIFGIFSIDFFTPPKEKKLTIDDLEEGNHFPAVGNSLESSINNLIKYGVVCNLVKSGLELKMFGSDNEPNLVLLDGDSGYECSGKINRSYGASFFVAIVIIARNGEIYYINHSHMGSFI